MDGFALVLCGCLMFEATLSFCLQSINQLSLFVIEVVPDREDVNIENYFDECFAFIDEAKRMGGGVLVHCFVGKSRRWLFFPYYSIT